MNNKVFCLGTDYWVGTIGTQDATAGVNTKNKLKTDMEAFFNRTADRCYSDEISTTCEFGSAYCYANYNGGVRCSGGSGYCLVYGNKNAMCS